MTTWPRILAFAVPYRERGSRIENTAGQQGVGDKAWWARLKPFAGRDDIPCGMDHKSIRTMAGRNLQDDAKRSNRRTGVRSRGCVRRPAWRERFAIDDLQAREGAVALNYVYEDSMESMARGDIILLGETGPLRELVDQAFFAILACPICGKLDLVTQAQYSGIETVICGYEDCACHFRINRRREIAYLPVN